jgi:spermidine synthase
VPYLQYPVVDRLGPLAIASVLGILPPTLLLGAAFPIGLELWASGAPAGQAAERVGVVYAANLAGAIGGAAVTGFLLIPSIGTELTLLVLASMFLASGLALVAHASPGRAAQAGAFALTAVFLIAGVGLPDVFDVIRRNRYPGERPVFREEGVQTTVAVHRVPQGGQAFQTVLYLDGLHQANDSPRMLGVHRRIGMLPAALHPDPRRALVIGLGGGATAGALSQVAGIRLDIVELSRSVVRGAVWFDAVNYGVVGAPTTQVIVDDGRNHLLLTGTRYDVITADIILPHNAGAGNLYSAEYYRLVRNALTDDGLVCQWIAPGPETQYKLMARTFLSVFPTATLWDGGGLLIGGRRPLRIDRESFERKLRDPRTRAALEAGGFGSFDALLASYTASPGRLASLVGQGPLLTDDRPVIEYFLSLPAHDPPIDLRGLRGDPAEIVR